MENPQTLLIICSIIIITMFTSLITYFFNKKNLPAIVRLRMCAKSFVLQNIAPNVFKADKFIIIVGKYSNIFISPIALKFTEMLKIERLTNNSGIIITKSGDHSKLYKSVFKGLADGAIGKFQVFETETGKIGYGSKKLAKQEEFQGSIFISEGGEVIIGCLQVQQYLGL
ncbi:hypothetical protein SS50377_26116 [Spironucleus salmonicida]|uniref:Uncharacterized protein n=1 Tax=Spironucleus salmonicida TaxID=348837 RepID=V6LNS3_9EUKA|nr:hypothetical protein SS50377_26116 [Spironucleus salmonicida]|eukprot:EST46322.1 Hypothetical protein SS50377_13633 [Spironucleus salmonicida]